MAGTLVGYARCSTDAQDLTAQRNALTALGVTRVYVDHGLTGTNRSRPGLREALAACHCGDTLVVTKLDRLARSLTDARDVVEELTEAGVTLNIGGSLHDPTDPVGRLLFNVLGMIAEFESDLTRMRTREGMKVAQANGRLRGKQPKLKPAQEAHLVELWRGGKHTSAELAELFSVARSTVYRTVQRAGEPKPARTPARESPYLRRRAQAGGLRYRRRDSHRCRGHPPGRAGSGPARPAADPYEARQARRRRIIVSALAATQVQATVYDAARRYRTDLAARTACLTVLVEDIATLGGETRLVIEQDDSVLTALLCRCHALGIDSQWSRPAQTLSKVGNTGRQVEAANQLEEAA